MKKIILALFNKYKDFIIFIIGGGVGALTNWFVSFILTSILGVYYVISYSLAQTVNITVNFLWHQYITFKVKDNAKIRFLKFFFMSILTACLSIGLVYLTKEFILDHLYNIIILGYDLNYLFTIIFITFVVSVLNFIISKLWVFKQDKRE
jgi:putative flippase GtrA